MFDFDNEIDEIELIKIPIFIEKDNNEVQSVIFEAEYMHEMRPIRKQNLISKQLQNIVKT